MLVAGSCFFNPVVTDHEAERLRMAGAPVHRTPEGTYRASAGWLLELCGYAPGREITPGVRCSSRRTLTLTAGPGATAKEFQYALTSMVANVRARTGVTLTPEPVCP
ncbi:hypothetical protein ACH4TP_33005 [Streptomyces sp. NPDC021012]|uniref:hypothetical protein n=1 Tax=Streptomyces sp. NPDC021012 TaxID=3365107 RepID=UPI003789FBB9